MVRSCGVATIDGAGVADDVGFLVDSRVVTSPS
jgi:hypothetical protein